VRSADAEETDGEKGGKRLERWGQSFRAQEKNLKEEKDHWNPPNFQKLEKGRNP